MAQSPKFRTHFEVVIDFPIVNEHATVKLEGLIGSIVEVNNREPPVDQNHFLAGSLGCINALTVGASVTKSFTRRISPEQRWGFWPKISS
jgi:hypothetical protein